MGRIPSANPNFIAFTDSVAREREREREREYTDFFGDIVEKEI